MIEAEFTTNAGDMSQLGIIIVIFDVFRHFSIPNYSFRESRRVTHSLLDTKLFKAWKGFDDGSRICAEHNALYDTAVLLNLRVDTKCLCDYKTDIKTTTGKRLLIDLVTMWVHTK